MPLTVLPKNKTYRERATDMVGEAYRTLEEYRAYVRKHIPNTSATFRAVMTRLEYRAKKIASEIRQYDLLIKSNTRLTNKADQAFYGFLGHFMQFLPPQLAMIAHDISTTAMLVKPSLEEDELVFDSKSKPGSVIVRETRSFNGSVLGMIVKVKEDLRINSRKTLRAGTSFFVAMQYSSSGFSDPLRYTGTYEEVKAMVKRDAGQMLIAFVEENATVIERMGKLNPDYRDSEDGEGNDPA